jgi:hypothetical protein
MNTPVDSAFEPSPDGEAIFEAVNAALLAWDPVHIGFVDDHEYDLEARLILRLLPQATSAVDVQRIVHAVFCRQFNQHTADSIEDYVHVADRIWAEWRYHVSTER